MTVTSHRMSDSTRPGEVNRTQLASQPDAPQAPVTAPRTVVIDTSSLLNDPALLDDLVGNHLVIPLPVVVELDRHKRRDDAQGAAARQVIRRIDDHRRSGDVRAGVADGVGGSLRILMPSEQLPAGMDRSVADHLIVSLAHGLRESGEDVEVVSDDAGMRVLAGYLGVSARLHVPGKAPQVEPTHPHGWVTLECSDADIDALWAARTTEGHDERLTALREQIPHPNGYALLDSGQRQVRARRRGDALVPLANLPDACGVTPRDHVQAFALDALADLDVPMVALTGAAGSGKTMLAIATGLAMVARKQVERVVVLRPITSVAGQEMGFLPGEVDDKFAPFTGAVADVLAAMPQMPIPAGRTRDPVRALVERGVLECMPVTYLRGRTLAGSFVVLDEAQNLSVGGVRTVATRIGEGAKLAVVGDPRQVDDPYLSASNNGLTRLLDAFHGQRLFAHLHLASVQRSDLAAVAAELL